MSKQKTAKDIKIKDVGRTVRSLTYPSKNKTAKPQRRFSPEHNGYRAIETEYTISSIYAHENGNILINQNTYLKADTPITFID